MTRWKLTPDDWKRLLREVTMFMGGAGTYIEELVTPGPATGPEWRFAEDV